MSENKKQEFGYQSSRKKVSPDKNKKAGDEAMLDAAKVGIRKYRNTLRRLAK